MVVYGSKQFVCCWWSTSWLYMYFQNRNFWNNNFVNWFINYCNHVFWDYCFFEKDSEIKRPPNDPLMFYKGSSCPWSYGSWIYNYICNQWLLPLMLWARISTRARRTTLCDKVCQWLATGPPMSHTNKTERHDITEILLKVALSTIKQTNRCSIRFAMHVYMVVKLLLLTMPTLYEIIVWWIFVVDVWQIVMSTLYFTWNHSLAASHQFYSFLELSEVLVYFFFKFFFLKKMTFFQFNYLTTIHPASRTNGLL